MKKLGWFTFAAVMAALSFAALGLAFGGVAHVAQDKLAYCTHRARSEKRACKPTPVYHWQRGGKTKEEYVP